MGVCIFINERMKKTVGWKKCNQSVCCIRGDLLIWKTGTNGYSLFYSYSHHQLQIFFGVLNIFIGIVHVVILDGKV